MKKDNGIDSLVTFWFLRKLLTPIKETDAFQLKLVDNQGNQIKEPKTDEEILALDNLQMLVFVLKKLLGTKLSTLNKFSFLLSSSDDFGKRLNIQGIENKSDIKRIRKTLENLSESQIVNKIDDYLTEMPHVELADDKYFDFEYEINKNFPKKLIDIYDGKTVKDSHGNSVRLNNNEMKGLTKRLVNNVFFMNMFKNSINNLSISQKQYYKERLPKEFFK